MTQKVLQIPESKSLANRFLLLSSFKNKASLPSFNNECEDIEDLRESLLALKKKKEDFKIRFGGTSFRFLLARLSREKGHFRIFASPKLLSRPHRALKEALSSLNVKTQWNEKSVEIESESWRPPPNHCLSIDGQTSSQFASALLLSCVQLPFPLTIQIKKLQGSRPYLDMTLNLLKKGGVHFEIKKKQRGRAEHPHTRISKLGFASSKLRSRYELRLFSDRCVFGGRKRSKT